MKFKPPTAQLNILQRIGGSPESIDWRQVYPTTCRDIKYADPSAISGEYTLVLNGSQPMAVLCDMTAHDGRGVTMVGHDSEARSHVKAGEGPGSYRRDVTYTGVTVTQLKTLTSMSTYCEQFLKYECTGSILYSNTQKRWYAWWVSLDGVKQYTWGGAPRGSDKCACAVTDSCIGNSRCNCDGNYRGWTEDSVMVTFKDLLPLLQLRFGDTHLNGPEQGYHTLGKLMCY
ncbi:contactin-associated protein-like 2 [Nematostella vectensis]|uniref:contactin-associated protein-like 2 n=1 Tax=Nematostella vectensis TaxID=45351 RepID=UPI0020777D56|nr:contactin-associated protein-like 2 [Nematostella vectensis]